MFLALPARACWNAPSAACFAQMWQDQALAYHAEGPEVERLYHLIDWGVIPSGAKSAQALLNDLEYDDLVAYHAGDVGQGAALELSEAEQAMRLLLGLPGSASPPEVNTDYLLEIYFLSLAANDRTLSAEWYQHLPDYMRGTPEIHDPGSTSSSDDPYVAAQANAVFALTQLREGQIEAALSAAAGMKGEPGFLVWLALVRHAISVEDTALLAHSVDGLNSALSSELDRPFDEEAFERALKAAEAEYAQSGDPDALVYALESADPSAYELPVGAGITAALAQRYLARLTNSKTEDGFDAALSAMQQALRNRDDEDDATPMLNARTALRLGMMDEAERLIALVDAEFPGVPGFFLYDLPEAPQPWADAWLTRMITRFDQIVDHPDHYDTREYWDIWLDQDALGTAIDITQQLALYDRRDEAFAFAERADSYLRTLPDLYPGRVYTDLAKLFDLETAAFLYPPDVAIPRMRQLGTDETQVQYAFAKAKRPVIALKLLAGQDGYRNLGHWMTHFQDVPDYLRGDYIEVFRPLIEAEAARLIEQGYPELAQSHHAAAAAFWAQQRDWRTAEHHYEQIEAVVGKHGPTPAERNRLSVLRDIVAALTPQPKAVLYPYEDFAL